MNKEHVNLLIQKIQNAQSIVIFGHKNPDGDSLGAALGLMHLIADNLGKSADVIYDGNLPFKYDFIPGRDKMVYAEKKSGQKYDLAICVDTPNFHKMGDAQLEFFNAALDTVKIDHHKSGSDDDFAKLNIVYADFIAAAEIIYEIANTSGWKISRDTANCLYVGIYCDTGGFSYVDNGNILRIVADLVDFGANARMVPPNLDVLTRDDILAEAASLSGTEFFYGGRLAVVSVPSKHYKKLDSGETPILMRMRSVKGVVVTVFLKEAKETQINISMRSETVPVRGVAEKLGGGGHDLAAAARLNVTLGEAKKIIVQEFKDL